MHEILLGKYLTLQEFCTCTLTYHKYADQIAPYPENLEETLPALEALCQHILDPVIDHFGRERFQLTYGFCSKDLKRFLSQKDPETGIKHGRVDPSRDQHMAHEKNRNGKDFFKNSKNGRMRKPRSLVQIMDQNFFNRILHLIHARPKQGRRMIGLGAAALWELWQRINQLEQAVHLKRPMPQNGNGSPGEGGSRRQKYSVGSW